MASRQRFPPPLIACIVLLSGILTGGHGLQSVQKKSSTQPSTEAKDRKQRSEAILKAEGVPINQWLPVIETEKESKRRSVEEVAWRALALLVVASKAEGLEQAGVLKMVALYNLEKHFSPKELAFIRNPASSDNDRAQFSWRFEAAWTLFWALGYVEKLEKPTVICEGATALKFVRNRNPAQFAENAKLRPQSEILDQADLVYRYDWAVDDARMNGREAPARLDPGVTVERHAALNWLIGYENQDWDDITTDT